MLTTVHPPFDSRIFHKESKSLAKAGHSVTIVAPSDSKSKKTVEGINIATVELPSSKVLHPLTMLRVFREGLKQDCDVYHCHEPGSLFVCSILKLIKRKKLVYDAHEHYSLLIANDPIFPEILRKAIFYYCEKGEKILSSLFPNSIVTVDDVLGEKFRRLSKNVWILNNFPKIDLFQNIVVDKDPDNKTLIYVGGLSKDRGTMVIIHAFEKVLEKIPDAKLLFVGSYYDENFKKEVVEYYRSKKLEKSIYFTGKVPHSKVADYMNEANVAISVLQPNGRYELGISVKFYEYMLAGLPIVINNFEYMAQLANEFKSGIPVNSSNIKEISDAIVWLFEHPSEARKMGESGRSAAINNFNWGIIEKKLLNMYEDFKI
ncbi:MAG: glycosyltransferase family 4 protein [Methanosarcina sp.]|nr:glycosyltransferase family 4 protein [Methanosarcina sp.]